MNTKTKRILIIFGAIICCTLFNFNKTFSNETSLGPKEIISKVIDAHGGEQVLRRLQDNYTAESSLYSPTGELTGSLTDYFKRPDKIRQEVYLIPQDSLIIKVYNAGKVHITQDGKIVKDAAQIESFRKSAQIRLKTGWFSLLYMLDHQDEVEYIGEESINGRSCVRLELFIDEDVKDTYFFDLETFLLTKRITSISSAQKRAIFEAYFYDFKEVEDALLPFRLETYQDNQKVFEVKVWTITFNTLDDSLFVIEEK